MAIHFQVQFKVLVLTLRLWNWITKGPLSCRHTSLMRHSASVALVYIPACLKVHRFPLVTRSSRWSSKNFMQLHHCRPSEPNYTLNSLAPPLCHFKQKQHLQHGPITQWVFFLTFSFHTVVLTQIIVVISFKRAAFNGIIFLLLCMLLHFVLLLL